MNTSTQSQTLQRAADARRTGLRALHTRHTQLIDDLAARPDDEAVLRQLGDVETELARASASIASLDSAAERAIEREASEALVAGRKASEAQRQRTLKAAVARASTAAAVDAAGDAFVLALKTLRGESRALAAEAVGVLKARHKDTALHHESSLVLPHASATGTLFAAALADIIKRAIAVVGADEMRDLVVMNDFAVTTGRDFAGANATAVIQLEARL